MQASGSSEEPIFPYHQRLNGTAHGVIGAERQERAESVITRFQQEAEAALAKCPSEAAVAETQSGQLAQGMSTCESNLKNTTGIGSDEHTTVTASEAKLMDAIGTLSRAIVILSKEMSKNPALLQQHIGSNVQSLVTTLGAVIDTFSFSNTDRQKLMALVQSRADSEDRELGASAAAVYKTQSSSILDVLEDMKHKADEELASLHKSETQATVAPAESAEELEDASWAKAHRRFARALELHATDKASPPPAPRQLADASGLTPASPTVTFSPVVAKKPAHLQSDRGSDLETGSHMNDEKEDLPEVGTATSTQQEAEAATAAVTASVAPPPPAPSQSMDASPRTPASPTVPFSTALDDSGSSEGLLEAPSWMEVLLKTTQVQQE